MPIASTLDLTNISADNRDLLVTTLRREINATQFTAEDTYFGGKGLYRSAQLLTLAKQLKEDDIASTIQQKLRSELTTWLSTTQDRSKKYFYYDSRMHSIVGETTSFGSEAMNDHHFHYGYFIYAASVLAKYDPEFLNMYGPVVDLLVADIANYKSNELLPLRRSFDPYFGHSWASGSAPFNDGNNQESSSEAINAWVAAGLWGAATNNSQLKSEAGWMLSNEVRAASSYWLNFNPNDFPYNQGYTHSLVSLNWGGKRDYATFFSSQPAALLGIQLIPLNPTMLRQLQNNGRIDSQIHEATSSGGYNQQFGDYLLMYTALQKQPGLLEKAKSLPDSFIDDANSRSYLYAWMISQTP
jgi:endo-1,3(4)-beta-glucanase